MQNANSLFIWSKCLSFELLHSRLCVSYVFWSYFLSENVGDTETACDIVLFLSNWEIKIQYNNTFLLNVLVHKVEKHQCCDINVSGQDYSPCRENGGDEAEEKFLLSNLPGHTNDIWRGLRTGVALQATVRPTLCPASILSHPKEPIIPGFDRSQRLASYSAW